MLGLEYLIPSIVFLNPPLSCLPQLYTNLCVCVNMLLIFSDEIINGGSNWLILNLSLEDKRENVSESSSKSSYSQDLDLNSSQRRARWAYSLNHCP